MSKRWILIFVFITFTILSCNTVADKTLTELFVLACQGAMAHGHAQSGRGYDYNTSQLTKFLHFISALRSSSGETIEIASPPITPDNMPYIDWAENTVPTQTGSADDVYFDQAMDGVRLGYLSVWCKGDTGSMIIPVIVSFNSTNKNTAYASVAFPYLAQSIFDQKPIWRAGYSGEVKIFPRSYPGTVDLSFSFDTKMMKGIIPAAKEGKKLKITLTGYFQTSGDFFAFNRATSKGYDPEFGVDLEIYKRMTQTLGMEGLWMGGFVDSIYAGEELGEWYHPITLLMKHVNTEYSGSNYMTLMTHEDSLSDLKITGKKLWVAESTPWGYAFDMERKGPDKLVGKFLYRLDPATDNYTYTLFRIGFGGNKMRLKRTIPKTAALGNKKNKPTLTIVGVGFAPGAMVFFSDPNIEIKEIEYVNNKKLKVTIQAIDPIKKGQKIGIRVINPDNRSVTKPGILKAK